MLLHRCNVVDSFLLSMYIFFESPKVDPQMNIGWGFKWFCRFDTSAQRLITSKYTPLAQLYRIYKYQDGVISGGTTVVVVETTLYPIDTIKIHLKKRVGEAEQGQNIQQIHDLKEHIQEKEVVS